jgi:hypothetical protein
MLTRAVSLIVVFFLKDVSPSICFLRSDRCVKMCFYAFQPLYFCSHSTYCYAWIAADVAVLLMFVVAFVISYRQMALVMRRFVISASTGNAGGGSLIGTASEGGASRMSPAPEGLQGMMSRACCISALQGEDYTLEKGRGTWTVKDDSVHEKDGDGGMLLMLLVLLVLLLLCCCCCYCCRCCCCCCCC